MNVKRLATIVAAGAAVFAVPAAAQVWNGDELRGQTVDISFADGTRNSVFFGSTGMARIANSTGQTMDAAWFVQQGQLCLRTSAATECWATQNRFVAGRGVQLTSTCDKTSTWTARAVNPMREAVAPVTGERG